MLPELFRIGSFPIRSYGVLLMIGALVGMYLAARRAPKHGIRPDAVWDALFWMMIPGILGARITYIAQNWKFYSTHTSELYSLQFNGLTSYGGLILGFVGLVCYIKFKKLPFWSFLDVIGVPVLVAHAFGRIGCLLNGCCHGYPCPPGAQFCVHVEGQSGLFIPAQGFDTVMCLIIAGMLALGERVKMRQGVSFSIAIAAYGLSRFIYEFWRAGPQDSHGVFTADLMPGTPITKGQAMAVVFILVGAGIAAWKALKGEPAVEGATAA